jgi:hypothetical protein
LNPVDEIQHVIELQAQFFEARQRTIFLNAILNEFMILGTSIRVPRIAVKELDYLTGLKIINSLARYIPDCLFGHTILEIRKPVSDQHVLQFVRRLKGKMLDFVHMFKIDLKFSGDPAGIVEKGNPDYYPAYMTDRLYYKSCIIPVKHIIDDNRITDFDPIRIMDVNTVESDQHFHTFAIFDDLNTKEMSEELCRHFDEDIFRLSLNLYTFFAYDYFTACFNALVPNNAELEQALALFEPAFIFLFARYRNIADLAPLEEIRRIFKDEIVCSQVGITLTEQFKNSLRNYFQRFSLVTDDALFLKGWRKFVIS